jgi:putative ABC transport system permease protein
MIQAHYEMDNLFLDRALLISCINFMNLSTARSTERAKEVGMRKVVGAYRSHIIKQFFGESVLLVVIALLLAIAIVEVSLPTFNALAGKVLKVEYDIQTLLEVIGVTLLVGAISGSYPAFLLSALQPIDILKGKPKAGLSAAVFRKVLVVVQFSISIVMIIGTLICYNQLDYLKNKNLGFNKEQVISIPIDSKSIRVNYEPTKNELLQNSNIVNVTASMETPLDRTLDQGRVYAKGILDDSSPSRTVFMPVLAIDFDFMKMFEIPIVAGRDFSKAYATDRTQGFILNEEAVRVVGWKSPTEAIGKPFRWRGYREVNGVIIGVVKDFHFSSLYYKVQPLVFLVNPGWFNCMLIKIRPENTRSTLAFIEKTWHKRFPDRLFEYVFLDDIFDRLYWAEERQSKIFGTLSVLAIFIACLGLFGLASFTVEQRTKEIGIRKVMGASVYGIAALLSKEFVMLVGVANLIAWPVAYYAMSKWLQNFAYRTDLRVETFVLGGILTLVIALLTVSAQAAKAARANPVDALRYE